MSFSGKHALITGGTSGIGRAIAEALRDAGAVVSVAAETVAQLDVFCAEVPGIAVVELDVTSEAEIGALFSRRERLDILINCAGIIRRQGAEFNLETFQQVLDVNLTGTMRMCVSGHKLLAQSKGCILNIASVLSFFGSGFVPAYSASKGGIAQLTKSLAIAWAEQGIRVNALAPGWIDTPLTGPLVSDPVRRQAIIDRTPMRRWGGPEDVAGAALFLCSPAAEFITGVVLPVDGGYCIA